MVVQKAELRAMAAVPAQYPPGDMPEIAFAGRSNVGKSSLINLMLERKQLARVSGNPGKTRTINFYEVNGSFRIVDLPGYGYARVARSVSEEWGKMIETYLLERKNLLKVVQLVDCRHDPSAQDLQMYAWLRHYGLDGLVVATKADKLSGNAWQKQKRSLMKCLEMDPERDRLIPVSTLKKTGRDQLLSAMEELIAKWQDG